MAVKFVAVLLTVFLLGMSPGVWAASFEEGLDSLRAGNPERARDVWLPLAEDGNPDAQYSLAKLFEHGNEKVEQDLVKAVYWYREAASQNLPAALNNLGLMYAQGRGVPRDAARATELWRSAALEGYPWAQYNLGLAYFKGQGVEVDQRKAVDWFRRAADKGVPEAEFIMGQLRREGLILDMDRQEALAWYRRAAKQGHIKAMKQAQALETAGIEPREPEPVAAPADLARDSKSRVADSLANQAPSPAAAGERLSAATPAHSAPNEPVAVAAGNGAPVNGVARPGAAKPPVPGRKPDAVQTAAIEPQAVAPPGGESAPVAPQRAEPKALDTPTVTARAAEHRAAPRREGVHLWLASARSDSEAKRIWRRVQTRHSGVLSGTEVEIAQVDLSGKRYYRILAGPVEDRTTAGRLCERLQAAQSDAFCAVRGQ